MPYTVSLAPHIFARDNTSTLMRDMLIALFPCAAVGVWLFGWNAARVLLLSIACCVALEMLYQKLTRQSVRIGDLSAAVTGALLALNLPSTAPWWLVLVGALVAVVLVKQLFGGIGHNFINPALAARAVLLASWPARLTATSTASAYPLPFDTVTSATVLGGGAADAVTSATTHATDAVASATQAAGASFIDKVTTMDLFLGNIPGCIGEVCKVAILLGLIYLLLRKVISWHIPVVMIGTFMLASLLFGADPVKAVLSGGVLFAAVFMATDYTTSPMTRTGKCVYAFGAGLIVALIRSFGGYPEGATYGVLLMNVCAPLIDRAIKPRVYGEVKARA